MNAPFIRQHPRSIEEIAADIRARTPAARVEPFPDNSEPWGWDAEPEPYPFWKDEK